MQDWTITTEGKLYRQFLFTDFSACLPFMVRAGIAKEKMNHYAEFFNVYSQLELWLCTHDAGNQVTEKDHKLAEKLDLLYRADA